MAATFNVAAIPALEAAPGQPKLAPLRRRGGFLSKVLLPPFLVDADGVFLVSCCYGRLCICAGPGGEIPRSW